MALLVPKPQDLKLITGCDDHCDFTLNALNMVKELNGLSTAGMVVELFACIFVCCMTLAALGDPDFAGLGFLTMCCFTLANFILHCLTMVKANSVVASFGMIQDANCFDLSSTNGNAHNTILNNVTNAAELAWGLGLVILIIGGIEICCGMAMLMLSTED